MIVLTEADLTFFREQGYVVVPKALPPENLQAVIEVIWEFLGADPGDPESWYRIPPRETTDGVGPLSLSGMVEIYQHQALWNNRQHPRVYQAFADIWGTPHLWVSLDRANMKPPVRSEDPVWQHSGFVHWDIDTDQEPLPFLVQGVLYLTDTTADQGGFQCVPGFPMNFADWVCTQPTDRDPRFPDLTGLEVQSIPGRAGDLLIWNSLLPHGNGPNTSDRPRLAQYITMNPADPADERRRQQRISSWKTRKPDPIWPGDPRGWELRQPGPAKLTKLGRRLLGIDPWPGFRDGHAAVAQHRHWRSSARMISGGFS